MKLIRELLVLKEEDDLSILPELAIKEIKKNIRKGAQDLEQGWVNALELVHQAYVVAQITMPEPDQEGAWKQYEEMIRYGVEQLAAARGLNAPWRMSANTVSETVGQTIDKKKAIKKLPTRRFFVEIPGMDTKELEVGSMDDAVHHITNAMRKRGKKVIVKYRDKQGAVLSVHDHEKELETITIKEV